MSNLVHKHITGTTAVKIASSIEQAIRTGDLAPGDRLPAVRELAGQLNVSPATVASAYQSLQARAVVVSHRRHGTRVSHRPRTGARRQQATLRGGVDLSDGNPDPALLPSFRGILRHMNYQPRLYGGDPMHAGLMNLMGREMAADGVMNRDHHQCAAVNGTMDGIDRLLAEHLRPGDRIAVEDPGFTGHHDLIASRGLTLVPVRIDSEGMMPDALERACVEGVKAVLITLRAQSPTGAAISAERARELRRVLRRRPDALIIEDDHLSFLCCVPCECVHDPSDDQSRWAHFRSFSKSFNPDLRLAVMTGDDQTMTSLIDRLMVVERWVSYMLQEAAYALLRDKSVRAQIRRAGRLYDQRREMLIALLEARGLKPMGRSGYNIWLPVQEETPTVQALAAQPSGDGSGWVVAAGERFRLSSPPGIRITTSRLDPQDATKFADALVDVLFPAGRSSRA